MFLPHPHILSDLIVHCSPQNCQTNSHLSSFSQLLSVMVFKAQLTSLLDSNDICCNLSHGLMLSQDAFASWMAQSHTMFDCMDNSKLHDKTFCAPPPKPGASAAACQPAHLWSMLPQILLPEDRDQLRAECFWAPQHKPGMAAAAVQQAHTEHISKNASVDIHVHASDADCRAENLLHDWCASLQQAPAHIQHNYGCDRITARVAGSTRKDVAASVAHIVQQTRQHRGANVSFTTTVHLDNCSVTIHTAAGQQSIPVVETSTQADIPVLTSLHVHDTCSGIMLLRGHHLEDSKIWCAREAEKPVEYITLIVDQNHAGSWSGTVLWSGTVRYHMQ